MPYNEMNLPAQNLISDYYGRPLFEKLIKNKDKAGIPLSKSTKSPSYPHFKAFPHKMLSQKVRIVIFPDTETHF